MFVPTYLFCSNIIDISRPYPLYHIYDYLEHLNDTYCHSFGLYDGYTKDIIEEKLLNFHNAALELSLPVYKFQDGSLHISVAYIWDCEKQKIIALAAREVIDKEQGTIGFWYDSDNKRLYNL